MEPRMFKHLRTLLKVAILLIAVALILDLHYKGKSSREYAKEYGQKAFQYLHRAYKNLVGKDLEELAPKSLSDLPKKVKSLTEDPDKKNVSPPSDFTTPAKEEISKLSPPSAAPVPANPQNDGLTEQDRERMRKLLEEKMQKN